MEERTCITIVIQKETRIKPEETNHKNVGPAALSKIYHELGLHSFLKNRQHHTMTGYDANNIMKLITYGRLLFSAPKKNTDVVIRSCTRL